MYLIETVSFSGIREKLNSKNLPVVLHVRLSVSPLHTDAIPGGEITAPPTYSVTEHSHGYVY